MLGTTVRDHGIAFYRNIVVVDFQHKEAVMLLAFRVLNR